MCSWPRCSSFDLTCDGHDERGRIVYACAGCGRHATSESASLVSGHRFRPDVILLAVRYYLQLGAAAERIAGILADRGVDVSGRTILRWVQKFGPALAEAVRQHRKRSVTTWLVDETYVKILGKWHYLYRGIDLDGQVLDCWLSATRDLPAAEAFFRRTITSTCCVPEHIVTDKATFYPSAIGAHAPDARHTATGFYNRVISTNRCERNHGYLKSPAPTHARAEECRLRQALIPRPRRAASDRTWLRRSAMYRAAARRRTELRARLPRRRHRQPARSTRVERS